MALSISPLLTCGLLHREAIYREPRRCEDAKSEHMTKYAINLLILLLVLAGVSFSQSANFRPTPNTVKNVEAYLDKLEAAGYSGTAMIAFNGKPVISRGIGYSDREQKIKNS